MLLAGARIISMPIRGKSFSEVNEEISQDAKALHGFIHQDLTGDLMNKFYNTELGKTIQNNSPLSKDDPKLNLMASLTAGFAAPISFSNALQIPTAASFFLSTIVSSFEGSSGKDSIEAEYAKAIGKGAIAAGTVSILGDLFNKGIGYFTSKSSESLADKVRRLNYKLGIDDLVEDVVDESDRIIGNPETLIEQAKRDQKYIIKRNGWNVPEEKIDEAYKRIHFNTAEEWANNSYVRSRNEELKSLGQEIGAYYDRARRIIELPPHATVKDIKHEVDHCLGAFDIASEENGIICNAIRGFNEAGTEFGANGLTNRKTGYCWNTEAYSDLRDASIASGNGDIQQYYYDQDTIKLISSIANVVDPHIEVISKKIGINNGNLGNKMDLALEIIKLFNYTDGGGVGGKVISEHTMNDTRDILREIIKVIK